MRVAVAAAMTFACCGSRSFAVGDLLLGSFRDVAPAHAVTFNGSARLATFALGGRFKGTPTSHLFDNAFRIKLGLQSLQGAVYRFALFELDASLVVLCHTEFPFRVGRGG